MQPGDSEIPPSMNSSSIEGISWTFPLSSHGGGGDGCCVVVECENGRGGDDEVEGRWPLSSHGGGDDSCCVGVECENGGGGEDEGGGGCEGCTVQLLSYHCEGSGCSDNHESGGGEVAVFGDLDLQNGCVDRSRCDCGVSSCNGCTGEVWCGESCRREVEDSDGSEAKGKGSERGDSVIGGGYDGRVPRFGGECPQNDIGGYNHDGGGDDRDLGVGRQEGGMNSGSHISNNDSIAPCCQCKSWLVSTATGTPCCFVHAKLSWVKQWLSCRRRPADGSNWQYPLSDHVVADNDTGAAAGGHCQAHGPPQPLASPPSPSDGDRDAEVRRVQSGSSSEEPGGFNFSEESRGCSGGGGGEDGEGGCDGGARDIEWAEGWIVLSTAAFVPVLPLDTVTAVDHLAAGAYPGDVNDISRGGSNIGSRGGNDYVGSACGNKYDSSGGGSDNFYDQTMQAAFVRTEVP
jgi:hypothetical protein